MSRRFIKITALGLGVCTVALLVFYWWGDTYDRAQVTDQDLNNARVKLGQAAPQISPAPAAPIDLKRSIRLAVGGLGLDDPRGGEVGDLLVAGLRDAKGLDLVERQSLEAALREAGLSLSGLVRARDAIAVGKLVRADWFLLGTEATINKSNSLVLRVVDARTGVLREAAVFPAGEPVSDLASDIGQFVRRCREDAAEARVPNYLAIGAFQDIGLNARHAELPELLRSHLTAAYRNTNITLLEREAMELLLQESRLDLAGMTENGGTNAPQPLQSAYWLVEGYYQSYETSGFEVELIVDVRRMFGQSKEVTFRGLPDDALFGRVKNAVDATISVKDSVVYTRVSEARAQFLTGKELVPYHSGSKYSDLVYSDFNDDFMSQEGAKRKRRVEDAIRAFETAVLLDPDYREAKMWLAVCFRDVGRVDEARDYYREVIEAGTVDEWTDLARKALDESFNDWYGRVGDPAEKARWFEGALHTITNSAVADFYRSELSSAAEDKAVAEGGAPARALAEKRLLEDIQFFRDNIQNRVPTIGRDSRDMGMADFVKAYGGTPEEAGQRLTELYPTMTNSAPELAPYILATLIMYQSDTNSPMIKEFKHDLEVLGKNPNNVMSPAYYWNLVSGEVYNWCLKRHLFDIALLAIRAPLRIDATQAPPLTRGDEDTVKLAYAYLGMNAWTNALILFESLSNRPVQMYSSGPWGRGLAVVLPDKEAARCQKKLGLATDRDPREFDMVDTGFCLCTPSAFTLDASGIWVAIEDRLLHLDFELRTNLAIRLPKDPDVPITWVALGVSNVWVATDGQGLIEMNKSDHRCRRVGLNEGLLMNNIATLCPDRDTLWIGYGHGAYDGRGGLGGGLGRLDIATGRVTSLMQSLIQPTPELAGAPRIPVMLIAAGSGEDIWFMTDDQAPRLHRYRPGAGTWEEFQAGCKTFCANDSRLYLGRYSEPGVSVFDFHTGVWRPFKTNGVVNLSTVTALATDRYGLWVGGLGYIALLDRTQDTVLRFATIKASDIDRSEVERIETGGGYLWAQYGGHLHRAALKTRGF